VAGTQSPPELPAALADLRTRFNHALEREFDRLDAASPPAGRLIAAARYAALGGGKRLRALLTLESARVAAGNAEIDAFSAALPAAMAMECVHAFSLVHDDLPAMDDDDYRRGRPTAHKAFDEAEAILAGDWLLTYAFRLLAEAPLPPDVRIDLSAALGRATCGMIAGQSADIAGEQLPPGRVLLEYIHRHKTAMLLEAACVLGARSVSASGAIVSALGTFGQRLGLAFQIADDVLDATGNAAELNKPAGQAVLGLPESKRVAEAELSGALAALAEFGPEADNLRAIARLAVHRAWPTP
jgi:geranylgeranyl pyrophosphate synthase